VALQICNLQGFTSEEHLYHTAKTQGYGKQYSLYTHPMMTGV